MRIMSDPDFEPVDLRNSAGVTVHDVARMAGVSAITVSRALNKPKQLSPATLERVLAAVERSGYVTNRLAGGLRSNRSRLVAAVVPTISGPVFLETIESMTAALAESGYQLMLGQSGYSDSREDDLLEAVIARRPDAIVLTGVAHTAKGRRRLLGCGIPVLETWDMTASPIDMLVGFSHEAIGAAVWRFAAQGGARRPALIAGDDDRSRRRARSFVDAARATIGEVPVEYVPAPTTLASGRSALARLVDAGVPFDFVFCSSDLLALGVMTEAQARGLEIPEAFSLVGFGDLAFASSLHPALTTVRIDGTAIGRIAAGLIVRSIEREPIAERVVDVGFEIVARATTFVGSKR
jgi:LacI family gluconate utilization system Gnt-I transcriptional repressor